MKLVKHSYQLFGACLRPYNAFRNRTTYALNSIAPLVTVNKFLLLIPHLRRQWLYPSDEYRNSIHYQ